MTNTERFTAFSIATLGLCAVAIGALHFIDWIEHHMTIRADKVGR